MSHEGPSSSQTLRASSLGTPEAVFQLGLLCSQMLQARGEVQLHINQQGEVELIPIGECELDILPEQAALQALVAMNYTDNQLLSYLQGREQRLYRRRSQKLGLISDEAGPVVLPSAQARLQEGLVQASFERVPVPANSTKSTPGHQTEGK